MAVFIKLLVCVCVLVTIPDIFCGLIRNSNLERQKRATGTVGSRISEFINQVGEVETDLVFIMDRSRSLGREQYYLHLKKLLQALLVQYAVLHPDYVRMAAVSFGRDSQVEMDFISTPTPFTKAQLFTGNPNLYEGILFNTNQTVSKGTNLIQAFSHTKAIFEEGKKHRPSSEMVVLMATDGDYETHEDPFSQAESLKRMGARIYGVGVGHWLETGNVRDLTSDPSFYAGFNTWERMVQTKLTASTPDAEPIWMQVNDSLCLPSGCGAGAVCHTDARTPYAACLCKPGFHLTAMGDCTECPVNTYKEKFGNHNCTKCPLNSLGKSVSTTGAILKSQCACPSAGVTGNPLATDGALSNNVETATPGFTSTPAEGGASSMGSSTIMSGVTSTVSTGGASNSAASTVTPSVAVSTSIDIRASTSDIRDFTCYDVCAVNSCGPHAECVPVNETAYRCDCRAGWAGPDCDVNPDNCPEHLCENSLTCVDALDSYLCVCRFGYRGRYCEIDESECPEMLCENNATCVDKARNFECRCQPGYKGRFCQDSGSVPEPIKTTTTTTTTTTVSPSTMTMGVQTTAHSGVTTTVQKVTTDDGQSSEGKKDGIPLYIIIAAAVGGFLLLLILLIICVCVIYRRKRSQEKDEVPPMPAPFSVGNRFSGLWKKQTLKHYPSNAADYSDGVPTVPKKRRPDVVSGVYTDSWEAVNIVEETIVNNDEVYENGDNGWNSYFAELNKFGVMKYGCIFKKDGDLHASCGLYLDIDEVKKALLILEDRQIGVHYNLQGNLFDVITNDGSVATGTLSDNTETVTFGKTRLYIVVGVAVGDSAQCQKEIEWVVDHITNEGY